jgi:hypothetical protein
MLGPRLMTESTVHAGFRMNVCDSRLRNNSEGKYRLRCARESQHAQPSRGFVSSPARALVLCLALLATVSF